MQASTTNGSTNGHRRRTKAPPAASSRPNTASAAQQRPVPVRREVDGEQDRSERPRAEAREPLDAGGRHEQEREPEAPDHAAEVPGHGVTTTTARATWPFSATRRT